MDQSIAIIDLGTNTCNLLIAEYGKADYRIRYQGKEVVKLGKGGIDKNLLTEDGLERAVLAIQKHQERIANNDVSEVVVLATSAVRDAANKDWFREDLERRTGIQLSIISGEKEADLIFKGVKLALGKIENHSLILDIGGGSNEFILTEAGEPVWKQSFTLGMARIIEQFSLSDPITPEEVSQLKTYFKSRLDSLWNRTRDVVGMSLIGCSGAFDTIADLIDQTDPGEKIRISQEVKIDDFLQIFGQLLKSTTSSRMEMKGMESIRVEMIVPSVIFIQLVVERLNIQKIYQTDYALREGVLYERIFS